MLQKTLDPGQESRRTLQGMASRRIPSGKDRRPQMRDALETFLDAADEKFASPDGSIVAITRTVEGDAQDTSIQSAVLGEHTRNMGAVMLHRHDLGGVQGLSEE